MTETFRITLAQLNPTMGDLAGNAARAKAAWDEGKANEADLVALLHMLSRTQDGTWQHSPVAATLIPGGGSHIPKAM